VDTRDSTAGILARRDAPPPKRTCPPITCPATLPDDAGPDARGFRQRGWKKLPVRHRVLGKRGEREQAAADAPGEVDRSVGDCGFETWRTSSAPRM